MKKNDFQPVALPTIPETEFVYHVVRRVSPMEKIQWLVRRVRYENYVLRLRHYGDDGMYFASETVANDVAAVKQKYEKDVLIHAPKAV